MIKKSYQDASLLESEPPALIKLRRLTEGMDAFEKTAFKRYIRNYSDKNKYSKYILLFDCINDCLNLVKQELKLAGSGSSPGDLDKKFFPRFAALFTRRKIFNPRDLATKAHYLYEKILESLRPGGLEHNLRRELYARMLDIQLLFYKELYENCLEMVLHAKELAERLEALPQLLELQQIERNILLLTVKQDAVETMRIIYEAEQKHLQELRTSTYFNDLRNEMLIALWSGTQLDGSEKLRAKINSFLQYITSGAPRNSFDTAFNYHNVMTSLIWLDLQHPNNFLKFLKHEGWATVVEHLKAIVDLYKKYPLRQKEAPHRYRMSLINYLTLALSHDIEVDFQTYEQELDDIQPNDPAFLYNVVYLRLIYQIKKRQFKEGKDFIIQAKLANIIEINGAKIPASRLQVIRHSAGLIYFVREEFAEANKWFEANLKMDVAIKNAEAQVAAALYSLVCRFELGYSDSRIVARKLLEPLENMLEFTDDPESFESGLLESLLKMFKAGSQSEQFPKLVSTALPMLQERLSQKKDPGHFNLFIGWLESKKQGKPLRFVVDKYI